MKKPVKIILCCFFVVLYGIYIFAPSSENKIPANADIKPTPDSMLIEYEDDDEETQYMYNDLRFVHYPYTVSDEGKEFIKKHESLRLTAYNDPTPSKRSIGWGHQIQPGENYETITKKQADEIFEQDIKKIEASVNRLLKKTNSNFIYTQGFIDGLASLVYNCGEYGVSTTDFYQRLLKCRVDENESNNINKLDLNFTLAAVKSAKVFSNGHKIRRAAEYDIMMN